MLEFLGYVIAILLIIGGILMWMRKDSEADNAAYGGTEVEDKKGEGP